MRTGPFIQALAFVLLCSPASAQWVATNGPRGGAIACFAASGGDILAGGEYGLYRSTDDGISWNVITASWSNLNSPPEATALVVSEGNIFVTLRGAGGIYRSTNAGSDWDQINGTGLWNLSTTALAVLDSTILVGTEAGIFRSSDGGSTWNNVLNLGGRGGFTITTLLASGGNIFAGTYFGAFLSTNGGSSWTQAGLVEQGTVTSFAVADTHLFAGTWFGVYCSTNNGTTWAEVDSGITGPGLNHRWVNSLVSVGNSVFAGTDSGIFSSTNYGAKWSSVSIGLVGDVGVGALAAFPSRDGSRSTMLAGTGGDGIYASIDSGASWHKANAGLHFEDVVDFALCNSGATGTKLFAATIDGLFSSTNNGANWSFDRIREVFNAFEANDSCLIGGGSTQVCVSTDQGTTWKSIRSPFADSVADITALSISGRQIFAGTNGAGVFLSNDNGMTWRVMNNGLPMSTQSAWFPPNIVGICTLDSIVFVGMREYPFTGNTGSVYRSTDNGAHWSSSLQGIIISTLAVCGKDVFVGTGDKTRIYRSTDKGTSWSADTTGLPHDQNGWFPYVRDFCVSGTSVFAGTDHNGVFLSSDGGTHWSSVNTGLPNCAVSSLVVSGQYLVASMVGAGVYRRPLSEMITSVVPAASESPHRFLLEQNYPNPFNPRTTIRFELLAPSIVHLTVYDVLGRVVLVLVDEKKNTGAHEVDFDGSALASGVYYYRLTAGNFEATKSMLLLK